MEQENDQLLDGGLLRFDRRLYYRELIARFGHHLALNWNLGEENTNDPRQVGRYSAFFKAHDPYKNPVVVHSFPDLQEETFGPQINNPDLDGVSIQALPKNVHGDTLNWLAKSSASNRNWIVCNDEQNPAGAGVLPDADDPKGINHDLIRKQVRFCGTSICSCHHQLLTLLLPSSFFHRLCGVT